MPEIKPEPSAALADAAYELTRSKSANDAITTLNFRFGGMISFSEEDILKAKTGGPWFIKCRTAFGFTLLGKGSYKDHAFIIFRGTQYLADWLTNLNISASRTTSGQPVHDGFNMTFKTMQPKLREFMGVIAKNNITNIHCIGHSLGGALATLCGDWIRSVYKTKPYIYTYGSPRVGLIGFADHCTRSVGSERIFRVYHKTDIVPCIPCWPFIHTPIKGQDYYLPSPGDAPMKEHHDIELYLKSVREQPWHALAGLSTERRTDDAVVRWLKSSNQIIGLTVTGLEWLNQALIYVLKKCLNGAAWVVSGAFGTSFTVMDQLSYILKKGIDISTGVSDLVLGLVRKIMQFLGLRKTPKAADLTREFIRSLFLKLHAKVSEFTQRTLSRVLAKSRAI
jgi:triacylglycerol lipase